MKYLCLLLLFLFISCGTKSDKTSEDKDSLKTEAFELEDENMEAGESMDAEGTDGDESAVGSKKSYTLKWKYASYDEYGIGYGFEDKDGKSVSFFHLDIPGFTDENNEFYTYTELEDRIFPALEIREEVKDKWFEVTIEIRAMANEAEPSETENVPVIINIKPI